jgi:hypothetical protein
MNLSALDADRPLPPRKIPSTHFSLRLSRPQGHSAAGKIRLIETHSNLIKTQIRDIPIKLHLQYKGFYVKTY